MRSVFHRVGKTVGLVWQTGVERDGFMFWFSLIVLFDITVFLFEPPVWACVLLLLGSFALLVLFGLILLSLTGVPPFAGDEDDSNKSDARMIVFEVENIVSEAENQKEAR